MPRPVSRSVVIGLHYVQAEQVRIEVPAMYSAVSGAICSGSSKFTLKSTPSFCFLFRFAHALAQLSLGLSSVDHPTSRAVHGRYNVQLIYM